MPAAAQPAILLLRHFLNAMRIVPVLLVIVSLAVPRVEARGFLELLLGRRELEVISVTDMSPAGRVLPAASKEHPQYYIGISLGYRDLGAAVAGIEEPPAQDALRFIAAELAKQGYLPATNKSPAPTLLLAYTWGTLNADVFRPYPDMPGRVLNRPQILRFLGGKKIGFDDNFFDPLTAPVTGLQLMSYDAQNLYEISSDDFYIVVVSAYDLDALRQKRKQLLWMTRIATPSLGFDLGESMPAMLAIAGPHLGRETARPVWMSATEKFKPDVKLGELQLVEYLDGAPLPVVEKPAEPQRPKRPLTK